MDNFYTATVYSKGAEVINMYRTILGDEGFKKGMKLYFERHDGTVRSVNFIFVIISYNYSPCLLGRYLRRFQSRDG